MTAEANTALDGDDLGANKIFRSATAYALYNNTIAVAQRGTGSPWLNGIGAIEAITSGSGNWTVPAGVYRIKAIVVGGGGSTGSVGGDSIFGALTGGGGDGTASTATDTGGSASGGDVNIPGESGDIGISENPYPINTYINGGSSFVGGGIGKGGASKFSSASATKTAPGGGGTVIKVIFVEPGDLIAYAVGTGGPASSPDTAGTDGIIIIEY